MGQCLACLAASCFCSMVTSTVSCICSSCCGNSEKSGSGARVRSVLLFAFAIAMSFVFQYGIAPNLQRDKTVTYSSTEEYLRKSWTEGCEDYATEDLRKMCSGNNGVYRVTSATFLFFVVAAIISSCEPSFNRKFWSIKILLYLILVTITIFIPNEPLFTPIFLNVSRAVAALFIVFQQMVIIDMAYNLNESWVQNSNKAEAEEGEGAGNKWLLYLLILSGVFFLFSAVGIGLLYIYFMGCNTNAAFISITLVFGLLCTLIQLTGEEASLFTSMSLFAYATFLCYTSVVKNPNAECNPRLGEDDIFGIILGITVTFISLAWTGWSATAQKRLGESDDEPINGEEEKKAKSNNDDKRDVKGVVVEDYGAMEDEERPKNNDSKKEEKGNKLADSWKLNVILAAVTCWFAMTLTGWGTVQVGGSSANPDVGETSMWMIISAQWFCFTLYLWTLIAPRLFPDREFS